MGDTGDLGYATRGFTGSLLSTLSLSLAHRWMKYLSCLWHTCCRHRTRDIPTSARVATFATHCLSSYMDHTESGASQPSSLSSP